MVLLEEWAAQALLERHLGLPVSVVADANEKVQCVGQVSFIKLFTQPLFDIVAGALPGMYTAGYEKKVQPINKHICRALCDCETMYRKPNTMGKQIGKF